MKIKEMAIRGQEIRINGTCTGILPPGSELSEQPYMALESRDLDEHLKGARPLKGNNYLLDGKVVTCERSGFSGGNEYRMDCWTFVLKIQ